MFFIFFRTRTMKSNSFFPFFFIIKNSIQKWYPNKSFASMTMFAIIEHLVSYAQCGQHHLSGHMGVVNACDRPTWEFSFLVKGCPPKMTCLRRQVPNQQPGEEG